MLPPKQHFTVGKDEWDTKEVHEECIVHTGMPKAPLRTKRRQTVKNQAVALAVIGYTCLKASVTQSVENSIKKFFFNFVATC